MPEVIGGMVTVSAVEYYEYKTKAEQFDKLLAMYETLHRKYSIITGDTDTQAT